MKFNDKWLHYVIDVSMMYTIYYNFLIVNTSLKEKKIDLLYVAWLS